MERANAVDGERARSPAKSIALPPPANSRALQNFVAVCVLLYSVLNAMPASGANWFDGVPHQCASNLSSAFVAGGPLDKLVAPTDRFSFAGSGASVRLTYRLLSSDLPNPRAHYRSTVLTLDDRAKADLEVALTRAAGKDPLPVIEGLADTVLSIAPDAVGYVWTAVVAAAKAVFNVKEVSVDAIVPLLAKGGQVTRDVVVQRKSNKQLWGDVFWYYQVSVGQKLGPSCWRRAECRLKRHPLPLLRKPTEETSV